MPSVSLLNLAIMGSGLAAGDYFVVGDVSDTTQSAGGSDVRITATNFFSTIPVPIVVTSASAAALAIGRLGATTPAFTVDASTASQVAGLKVTGAGTGGTVAVVVTDSGANASLTINAKGSGTIGIGSVSTGAVTITPATTITGALTQTGLATFNGGAVIAASQSLTGTVANSTISGFLSVAATTGTFTTGAFSGNVNVAGVVDTGAASGTTSITRIQNVGGTTSITAFGPDAATAGAFQLTGLSSNSSVGDIRFTMSAAGAAVFLETLKSTKDFTIGASTFVVTAATGSVTAGANAGSTVFYGLNAAAGNVRDIRSYTASSLRWVLRMGDTVAESGANAGSNFQLIALDDAASVIGNVISATRSTLAVTLGGALAITGALTGVTTLAVSTSMELGTDAGTIDTQTLKLWRGTGSGGQYGTIVCNSGGLSLGGSAGITTITTPLAVTGAAINMGAGTICLGSTTQTTVGAAGGASALPATPTGYIKTYIGTTQFVIPYYAQA